MSQRYSTLDMIKPVQLSDRVYDEIEGAIVRCDMPPGEVLLDRQLSEVLGVSRTPVREALHRLQTSGLVKPRDRGGWVVADFEEKDIHELFGLRRLFEPLGIDQMMKAPDEAAIMELSNFFGDFPDSIPRNLYPRYFERDHQFHKRIVQCSSNSRVLHFYEIVEKQIHRGRHYLSTGFEGRVDANIQEHRDISNAIAAGDAAAAQELLLHHLTMGEELMVSYINEMAPQPPNL